MTKKTYREDKKKLKEFFKNEDVNLKKVFDRILEQLPPRIRRIIKNRYYFVDSRYPGYKKIYKDSWSDISSTTGHYSPQWTSYLFDKGIRLIRHPSRSRKKHLDKIKRELIKYVDKENINDKSVYLYIEKYFLFEDKLYELVTGKSLKEYFLYR